MTKSIDRRAFLTGCAAVSAGLSAGIPARAQQAGMQPASLQLAQFSGGGRMLAEFAGLSFDAGLVPGGAYFDPANTALVAYVRSLGPGLLRIGGPSANTTAYAAADLAKLAGFANASGSRVLLGIGIQNAPDAAAQQAAAASQALGDRLYAFELDAGTQTDYAKFLALYRSVATAIEANVPGARLAGPGTRTVEWARRFVADARANLRVLTAAYLHTQPDTAAIDRFGSQLDAAASAENLGYRVTDVASTGGNSLGGALWTIDFAFRLAHAGCEGINVHDTADAQPRATYRALQLLAESENAAFVTARLQSSNAALNAYAVERSDGTRIVTLLNRNEDAATSVSLDAGRPARTARVRRLTGLSLGTTQTALTDWAPLAGTAVDVPPASVAIVAI